MANSTSPSLIFIIGILACLGGVSHAQKTSPRIVTLSPAATSQIIAAGAGSFITGISAYDKSHYPEAQIVASFNALNEEKIILLKPTHIVANFGSFPEHTLQRFNHQGIKTLILAPHDWRQVLEDILMLSKEFQTKPLVFPKENQLCEKIRSVTKFKKGSNVAFVIQWSPLMVAGTSSVFGSLLNDCDFKVIGEKDYEKIPLEKLLKISDLNVVNSAYDLVPPVLEKSSAKIFTAKNTKATIPGWSFIAWIKDGLPQ